MKWIDAKIIDLIRTERKLVAKSSKLKGDKPNHKPRIPPQL
jgi:hypothetical protein